MANLVKLINNNLSIKSIILLIIFINQSSQSPIEYRRYCGDEIPTIMKIVCKGQYNGFDPDDYQSGSSRAVMGGGVRIPSITAYYNANNYFTNRRNNYNSYQSDIQETHQSQGQIVDECCKKPCGLRTLRTYCDIQGNDEEDLRDRPIPERPPSSISNYHEVKPQIITSDGGTPQTKNNNNSNESIITKKNNSQEVTSTTIDNKNKMVPRSFEIGTVSSAESNPHPIHDISSRAYHEMTDVTKNRRYF